MHFVGTDALKLRATNSDFEVSIRYDVGFVAASCLGAMMLVIAGVLIASQDMFFQMIDRPHAVRALGELLHRSLKESQLNGGTAVKLMLVSELNWMFLGGIVSGAGIVFTHFVGLRAQVFDVHMRWNQDLIALAIVLAVYLATIANWVTFRLLVLKPCIQLRLTSAFLLTVAICSTHYAAVSSAVYAYEPGEAAAHGGPTVSKETVYLVALWAALVIFAVVVISLLAATGKKLQDTESVNKKHITCRNDERTNTYTVASKGSDTVHPFAKSCVSTQSTNLRCGFGTPSLGTASRRKLSSAEIARRTAFLTRLANPVSHSVAMSTSAVVKDEDNVRVPRGTSLASNAASNRTKSAPLTPPRREKYMLGRHESVRVPNEHEDDAKSEKSPTNPRSVETPLKDSVASENAHSIDESLPNTVAHSGATRTRFVSNSLVNTVSHGPTLM